MQFSFPPHVIRVNIPGQAELLARIGALFEAREGFALATINLDHLVKLASDPAFRAAYAAHDLIVADGNPIVWLSRLAGKPVELVPGSDMVLPLARLARDKGVAVALLGSTDAVLEQTAADLVRAVPGLEIVRRIAPPFGFDPQGADAAAILTEIGASGAGLCFLALGAPKQELLAARGRELAPQTGFASIGAGLDFIAGTQKRAPVWVRRLALEWVWRMLSSPRRLIPRYARCIAILPGQTVAALRQRGEG